MLFLVVLLFVNVFSRELTLRDVEYLKTTNVLHPKEENLILFLEEKQQVDEPDTPCTEISNDNIECNFTSDCIFGVNLTTDCFVKNDSIQCAGPREFQKWYSCRFCWQLESSDYKCLDYNECTSGLTRFRTFCKANRDVVCMGSRKFAKTKDCLYTRGKVWLTALILSIFLGSLGVDRCYLGYGIGVLKGFTCGGLCVWAVIDVVFVLVMALGPADGSYYYV